MTPKKLLSGLILLAGLFSLGLWLFPPLATPEMEIVSDPDILARGEYLAHAAGCISCHMNEEDSSTLSGGRALVSDFGTFYVPNITPDPDTGIGNWSNRELVNAIKHGRTPDGGFYFPAFPYRSYAGMTNEDAFAIAAWLKTQPAVASQEPKHQLPTPEWLGRLAMGPWNRLADFKTPNFDEYEDPEVQHGAYLARHLGHCTECHTPRDRFGIPDYSREFAGAPLLDGEAEAIDAQALQYWSEGDLAFFLLMGLKPDDEYVGGEMERVIEHNTAPLTQADRNALAAFLLRGQQPP